MLLTHVVFMRRVFAGLTHCRPALLPACFVSAPVSGCVHARVEFCSSRQVGRDAFQAGALMSTIWSLVRRSGMARSAWDARAIPLRVCSLVAASRGCIAVRDEQCASSDMADQPLVVAACSNQVTMLAAGPFSKRVRTDWWESCSVSPTRIRGAGVSGVPASCHAPLV